MKFRSVINWLIAFGILVTLLEPICARAEADHAVAYELTLRIRDYCRRSFPEKQFPLGLFMKNVGASTIPSDTVMEVMLGGGLKLKGPDDKLQTKNGFAWRTAVLPDLPSGEVVEHPNCSELQDFFPVHVPGNYALWWTYGSKQSNSLKFELTTDGKWHKR